MISIEPPSFSLGFDLDAASEPLPGFDPDPGLTVSDSDLELQPDFSSPLLKRLRRGIQTICANRDKEANRDDEDIEDFSSQEDFDAPISTRSRFSSCSSSRVSLTRTSGVLTNQSSSISRSRRGKRKRLDAPTTTSGISSVSSLFERSACSPLRRFQLLDSDSEDNQHPSISTVTKTNDSFLKRKEYGSMQCSGDLWKAFSPIAISKIQTPALNDVCQDYFSSIKTSSTAKKQTNPVATRGICQQTRQSLDFSPPSHRFFMHSDPRIQNLARKRLPNFLPLGIFNGTDVYLVDYLNQFSSKAGDSSSKRVQTKSKVSKGRESSKTGSAGHWFTSPERRKVYISKSGQEFAGQSAYRCYRKETGARFNKSKKKRQSKKKVKN